MLEGLTDVDKRMLAKGYATRAAMSEAARSIKSDEDFFGEMAEAFNDLMIQAKWWEKSQCQPSTRCGASTADGCCLSGALQGDR